MNMSTTAEKIQKFFGLNDSDDYEESYTAEPAHVEQPEPRYSSPNRSYFQDEGTAENTRFRQTPVQPQKQQPIKQPTRELPEEPSLENVRIPQKVVQMSKKESSSQQSSIGEEKVKKISILEPRTYTESKNIAKCVFRNEIVIVNFHLVEESQARRIVDFLTGAVYALDGDIQRLGDEIFILTPPNTEIDSATAKSLLSTQFRDY